MTKHSKPPIYWTLLTHEAWSLYIAATTEGLCFIGSQNEPIDELVQWANTRYPGSPLLENVELLQPYTIEIAEYLQGSRKQFSISFHYQGTAFQQEVWKALCEIPYGETKSYSDIAHQIQRPAAVRAVGTAIGANPILITIPCHRVIGKNGSLTGYRGGIEMKTKLLQLEKH
ncbi:cysteine methyltransferase [Paenibacillus sp. FSL A5-0031]|uniref:methylated-DNA--[protein]-cysteine S-methyltransferase n=1 Tax=Paenibacillus sp. FSL A5-0031 TaxID=1920420 RepID=UPI00096EEFF8|nr:methylated-DNA--[protein]-cysteine S-methyltransferase [Paenibacillus sp. FSL A5-0031]OME80796.1 cysteine methyltransferase [Paenibacillus sp. FSL A5-0031]